MVTPRLTPPDCSKKNNTISDKVNVSAVGGQFLFTGLPRVAALARNDKKY